MDPSILARLFGVSSDDLLNMGTAQQTYKTAQGADALEKLLPPDPGRIPKFAGQPALAGPDNNIGRFAQPNLPQVQPGGFEDFLVNTLEGPPGQSFEDNPEQGQNALRQLGINAKENLGKVASIPYNIYKGLENLMSKTPVRTEEGKLNPDIIDESFNTAATLAGGGLSRAMITPRAARELGMAGGQIGQKRPLLSAQQEADIAQISNSVQPGWGHSKRVIQEFRAKHPDFVGSDFTIDRYARKFGTRDHRTELTPEMQKTFDTIHHKYHTSGEMKAKEALKEFYDKHPDYKGSWDGIRTKLSRVPKDLKPEDRARKWSGRPAKGMADDEGFELGSFGGRPSPKLKGDNPAEALNNLQGKSPVTKEWVENWAKDTNLPYSVKTGKGKGQRGDQSDYVTINHPNTNQAVTVRIPVQRNSNQHFSMMPNKRPGDFFDTALPRRMSGEGYDKRAYNTAINKSNMSYANPEALDAALKWKFSDAPMGRNWLIPEEMTPRAASKPDYSNFLKDMTRASDPRQMSLDDLLKAIIGN